MARSQTQGEQQSMMANLARKNILVLSDNEGLSRAIELNLNGHLELEIVRLTASSLERQANQENDNLALIILAVSSLASEPVVALSRASLADRIGQVPLLIISDRPFDSDPADRIAHLDFPFKVEDLHDKVDEILLGGDS